MSLWWQGLLEGNNGWLEFKDKEGQGPGSGLLSEQGDFVTLFGLKCHTQMLSDGEVEVLGEDVVESSASSKSKTFKGGHYPLPPFASPL